MTSAEQGITSPQWLRILRSGEFDLISAEPLPAIQFTFRLVIAVFGLASAWFSRFVMNPDGISYLDIGREVWSGNWHAAVNLHWSPLYAALAGIVIGVIRPSLAWEFPLVHLINFAILMATLVCFEFCWKELLRFAGRDDDRKAGLGYLWAGAYFLFIYIHLDQHGIYRDVAVVTPDLLVAALTYVASGLTLRICGADGRIGDAALLGAVLGVGYLAKAPMFPFAIAVLLGLLFAATKRKAAVATVMIALLAFAVVAAPLVAALSITTKRVTFGDSGHLAEAWYVNGTVPFHWQGTLLKRAQHPTRKISEWPEAYEFAKPVPGTYPLWFDPAYWDAGIDASIDTRLQLAALRRNMREYLAFALHDVGFLTAILLVLVFSQDRISDGVRRVGAFWPVLLPCAFMFLMYALVHWEPRFTTAFATICAATVFAVTGPTDEVRSVKFLRAVVLTLGIIVLSETTLVISDGRVENWNASLQVTAAERLKQIGMRPGESVAVIGNGTLAYWAHLAGLHIVAEVPKGWGEGRRGVPDSAMAFWSSPPPVQTKLLSLLQQAGARAVVGAAYNSLSPGWDALGRSGLVVHMFP